MAPLSFRMKLPLTIYLMLIVEGSGNLVIMARGITKKDAIEEGERKIKFIFAASD